MNFSTNQVMQFYVQGDTSGLYVDAIKKLPNGGFSLPYTVGGAEPETDGSNVLGRTDVIENVLWGKFVEAEAMAIPYTAATVTLNTAVNSGAPVNGETYILRVSYPEVGGLGVEGWTTKTAAVTADEDMTAAGDLYAALGVALEKVLSVDGVLTASGNTSGITIRPNDPTTHFEAGVFPVVMPQFTVVGSTITVEGIEVKPFNEDSFKAVKVNTPTPIVNGYKLADMEWFAMGERADQYRKIDWPNYIKTDYKINPTQAYDVLVVHFANRGDNANSHNSEKDIILAGATEDIAKAIEAACGVAFTKVAADGTETALTTTEDTTAEE